MGTYCSDCEERQCDCVCHCPCCTWYEWICDEHQCDWCVRVCRRCYEANGDTRCCDGCGRSVEAQKA